ncbi:C2 domain-containing protein [Pycnococcus provasolii]
MALGNLYVTIKDAYGAPAVNSDSWWKVEGSDAIADMYVTVVLKSDTPGVGTLMTTTSTVKAFRPHSLAKWHDQVVLPVHEGTEELRIFVCKKAPTHWWQSRHRRRRIHVVAVAGLYVRDIMRCPVLDKKFELFTPEGDPNPAGLISLELKFVEGESALPPARVFSLLTSSSPAAWRRGLRFLLFGFAVGVVTYAMEKRIFRPYNNKLLEKRTTTT